MKNNSVLRCYCPQCKLETNHLILHNTEKSSDDENYWWKTTYSVVKCMGCDNVQFHMETLDESNMDYNEFGEVDIVPVVKTYPHQRAVVVPIADIWYIPEVVRGLYVETMDCLNHGHLQLAAAGFRAIIEAICRDEKVQGRNLETMINNLAKAHIITAKDRDHLHAIRFMGNDSIHSLKKYSKEEVKIVAHIVNAVLTSLYLIASEVRNLDVKPISTYERFEEVLNESLGNHKVGEIGTLRNFIRHDRRIISEDVPKFESILKSRITDGKYVKLSLCAAPKEGRPQQYKIESI